MNPSAEVDGEMRSTFDKARSWMYAASARLTCQRGATAVEYALMLALIAAVIITAVTFLGRNTSQAVGNFNTQFSSAS